MIAMEDAEIVALYFDRSERAIHETEKKYGALCRSLAMNVLQNEPDAEECVADAYLAVWNAVPPEKPTYFKAYLCRIVRNTALKMLRRRTAQKRGAGQTEPLDAFAEFLSGGFTPESELDAKLLAQSMNGFAQGLNERNRYIFIRRYWYCDGVNQIADALGMRGTAVSATLYNLRKKLEKHLEKEGFEL